MSESPETTPSRDGLLATVADLAFSLVFLSVIGVMFVAFCVLLGKYELLILAYVLLGATVVRPFISDEQMKKLQRVAVIGEGLKIFTHLERYYLQHAPRSFFFYLFFPVTGIFSFFFSKERGRRELKAHFILVQWILVLLLIQGFASYSRFYQHFPWKFATTWLYMELLSVYFLCNFFAIPAATTPIRLSVTGRRKRLVIVAGMALIVMTGFLYAYKRGAVYDNLIPINIAMDRRMDALKTRVQLNYLRAKQGLPPLQKRQRKGRPDPEAFFTQFQDISKMFLRYQAPRILDFFAKHYFDKDPKAREQFVASLNNELQAHLQRISVFGENEQIFLTMSQEANHLWGLVLMPFRENLFYSFRVTEKGLQFYHRWEDMPAHARANFLSRWNRSLYRFASEKRLARVIVDTMREMSRKMAPQEDPTAEEEKPAQTQATTAKKEDAPAPASSAKDKLDKRPAKSAPAEAAGGAPQPPPPSAKIEREGIKQKTAEAPSFRNAPQDPSLRSVPMASESRSFRKKRTPKISKSHSFRKRMRSKASGNRSFRKKMAQPKPVVVTSAPAPSPIVTAPSTPPSLVKPRTPRRRPSRKANESSPQAAQRRPYADKRYRRSKNRRPPRKARRRRRLAEERVRRVIRRGGGIHYGGRKNSKRNAETIAFQREKAKWLPAWPTSALVHEVRELQRLRERIYRRLFRIDRTQKRLLRKLKRNFVPKSPILGKKTREEQLKAYWRETWEKALGLSKETYQASGARTHVPARYQAWRSLREMIYTTHQKEEILRLLESSIPSGLSAESDKEQEEKLRAELHQAIEQHRWFERWFSYQSRHLGKAFAQWESKRRVLKRQRAYLALYNASLRELHFERAIGAKLLFDHFGETPTLPPLWWADLYEAFLRLLLFLFQLTMPVHIFLIIYCQFRIKDVEETEEKEAPAH
ncbi:MAG: hypothetical protein H6728_04635 [Myxococcales bacterium]|nr:hypothetical protein [Myxococcales bacterium]MCB9642340.1 hypothetical protein [Myxococcales bacterium]